MSSVTDTVVDSHLARLDARACRAFVADVWAARGFETRVEDDVVVATRHGDPVVVFPACGGRIRPPRSPTRPVDVVVAPRGGDSGAAIADAHGARLLTAADLGEMLRYAMDPADADGLCERHLGAPSSRLRPPIRTRIWAHARHVQGLDSPVSATTVVAVVVLVVATAGFAVFETPTSPTGTAATTGFAGGGAGADSSGVVDDVDRAPDDDRIPGSGNGVAIAGSRTGDVGTISGVPGVDQTGVTNVTALAVAHDRALGNRSYALWLDTYRPSDSEPDSPRTQRDTDITVEGDRYLVRESLDGPDSRRLVRVVYFDGTDWYVDDRSTDEATIRWIDGTVGDVSIHPDPRALRERLVTRYLATPATRVTERVWVGETTRYRIEGEGNPPEFALDRVSDYRFVAFVDEHGLVHEATVEFTIITLEGRYQFRFEWTYGGFDATTVTSPAWIYQARPATETPATPQNRTTAT